MCGSEPGTCTTTVTIYVGGYPVATSQDGYSWANQEIPPAPSPLEERVSAEERKRARAALLRHLLAAPLPRYQAARERTQGFRPDSRQAFLRRKVIHR